MSDDDDMHRNVCRDFHIEVKKVKLRKMKAWECSENGQFQPILQDLFSDPLFFSGYLTRLGSYPN